MKKFSFKKKSNKLFLCGLTTLLLNSQIISPMVKCKIEGISNSIPAMIDFVITQLNNLPTDNPIENNFQNRLLLHGPTGNGKTTLATIIAQETKSHFIKIPSALGLEQKEIDLIFNRVLELSQQQNENLEPSKQQKVVLFINEIDSFASNTTKQQKLITQYFCSKLNEIKTNPRIYVVIATNKFKQLDPVFAAEFKTSTVENPNKEMRKELIQFFIQQINLKNSFNLDQKTIKKLINDTNTLSIKSIKSILGDIQLKYPATIDELIKEQKDNTAKMSIDPNEKKKTIEEQINQKFTTINNVLGPIGTAISAVNAYNGYQANALQARDKEALKAELKPQVEKEIAKNIFNDPEGKVIIKAILALKEKKQ